MNMPVSSPLWTDFLSCTICFNSFNESINRPISLSCGHTICKGCLFNLKKPKVCPFDSRVIDKDIDELPGNFSLLKLVSVAPSEIDEKGNAIHKPVHSHLQSCQRCFEELTIYLKPIGNSSSLPLSRPMQRKLASLLNCNLIDESDRIKAIKSAKGLVERSLSELILLHQNPQQLAANLWAAVRARGCQFLGPAMQDDALNLILMALEDGTALSRKVLVLFVVQRLQKHFPSASKTSVGHVVQLLYRASCFIVTKRDSDSSLMQLKEELRNYECLRKEHDGQIVAIAMEAGLRISPEHWSTLLYGDTFHKSYMQSIIDKVCKLQTQNSFNASLGELQIALQRTGDPANLNRLKRLFEGFSSIDVENVYIPTWDELENALQATIIIMQSLVEFVQNQNLRKKVNQAVVGQNANRYKTTMCRDLMIKDICPRGDNCTFAHSKDELDRHRQKNNQKPLNTSLSLTEQEQLDALNKSTEARLSIVNNNDNIDDRISAIDENDDDETFVVPTVKSSLMLSTINTKMTQALMGPDESESNNQSNSSIVTAKIQSDLDNLKKLCNNLPPSNIYQPVVQHHYYVSATPINNLQLPTKTTTQKLHELHRKKLEILQQMRPHEPLEFTNEECSSNSVSGGHLLTNSQTQSMTNLSYSTEKQVIASSVPVYLESKCCEEDDEIIPFSHSTISRFGPISRSMKTMVDDIQPVQVTAGRMHYLRPVTAVTPFNRGNPMSTQVPSMFSVNTHSNYTDHMTDPHGIFIASSLPTAIIGQNLNSAYMKDSEFFNMKERKFMAGDINQIQAEMAVLNDKMQLLKEAEEHRLTKELYTVEMNIQNTEKLLLG